METRAETAIDTATLPPPPANVAVTGGRKPGRPPSSIRFDWLMLAVGTWPLAGALSDAWAHNNVPGLETFFTLWHALLYSGLLVVGGCTALVFWRNHAQGYAWSKAIPPGYELTLVGVGVLAFAGIADLTWHTLFGIERDVPAIVSPSHILIILGILLIVAGPLRSAFSRPYAQPLRGLAQLPLILSTLLTYTMITIVLQIASPIYYRWASVGNVDLFANAPYPPADPYFSQGFGLMSLMISSAALMGFVLTLVRRWRLMPGALTILLTLNTLAASAIALDFSLVPGMFAAGVIGDLLILLLRPAPDRRLAFRLFAFLLPLVVYGAYFVNLDLVSGVVWIIHLLLGSIVVTGLIGLGLSYLVLPPIPATVEAPEAQ